MPYFRAAHALRDDRLGARRHRGVAWSALVLSAATAAATLAPNAAAQRAAPGTVTTTAAVSGVGSFNTGLDGAGSFRYAGVIASGSITKQIDAQWSVGINAGDTYENWSFDTPTAFGSEAPWGSINRPSVGFNVAYQAGPDLGFFVAPQFAWDYESGASGNRNNFGAVVGATKVFSRELVLGLGAGIFRQIDDTKVFPFLIVNWQIDDKWKLTNPFRAGPAGGAGLELVYRIDDQWEAASGGTYRDYRFRLKDSGPNANGIGQNQGVPLFARLSRTLAPKVRLDLYAGAVVGGTLKLRDPSGNTRVAQDYGAAPFLALTVAGEF